MNNFKVDSHVSRALINFVERYSSKPLTEEEISNFLSEKIQESKIFISLKRGLITKQEAVNFIVGHVFTEYAKEASIDINDNPNLEILNGTILKFVDEQLG